VPAGSREERKVVTVLFADLVGFTSRSERLDIEDVRAMLTPYYARLRTELERHGGTVEKFIGDAVMAVFGVPVAHEDDPERAVRAALSISEAMRELNAADERFDLHVRVGVNTGETLVTEGSRVGEGGVVGDIVNTAARLQSAAPTDGVLVGEATVRATERAITYEPHEPIDAKGKAEPVLAWVAVGARSRLGSDVRQAPSTPMVDRERERRLLWEAFDRARAERSPQLVTLIGVPGIGKSRLVWELLQRVEADPGLTRWRQGRSLPYGDGVAFWALGEMVKAEAGILDDDTPDATAAKLEHAVATVIESAEDRAWVVRQLRPLVGLASRVSGGGDQQGEAFAAWRRFVEALAEQGPAVLVFEDLHWADEALLSFIEYLLEWASGIPLMVLCTARPELLDRRRGFASAAPNMQTIALSPLSRDDTADLVSGLLLQTVLPEGARDELLARSDGNPLFAEEYVRMLAARGRLGPGQGEAGSRVAERLPETVQGIIAARIDTLTREERAVLQAAAVVGKVFWLGAIGALTEHPAPMAETLLHRLERKQFVRRERSSSIGGEIEYAFHHILIRDVAYARLPRAERAREHARAAEWIASLSRERDDRVEMLAHHYLEALALASALREDTSALGNRAWRALCDAGDHAVAVSSYATAARYYEAALAHMPTDSSARTQALYGLGISRLHGETVFSDELIQARDALLASGQIERAADADVYVGGYFGNHGESLRGLEHVRHAVELLADRPDSVEKAYALTVYASFLVIDQFEYREPIALCERALRILERVTPTDEVRRVDIEASAWMWIGSAKLGLGDPTGAVNLLRSVDTASDGRSTDAALAYSNISAAFIALSRFEVARTLIDELERRAHRLGSPEFIALARSRRAELGYYTGDWGTARTALDEVVDGASGASPAYCDVESYGLLARLRARTESPLETHHELDQAERVMRRTGERQMILPALAPRAENLLRLGRVDDALDSAMEALGAWSGDLESQTSLAALARTLEHAGRGAAFLDKARSMALRTPLLDAACAIARGDYLAAADIYAGVGDLADEADARLDAAMRLGGAGRSGECEGQLHRVSTFALSVRADYMLQQVDALRGDLVTAGRRPSAGGEDSLS
jgi:class 3 adenylate cyclase/tetratricopeptide (TPR) repeat protein